MKDKKMPPWMNKKEKGKEDSKSDKSKAPAKKGSGKKC